MVDVMSLLRVGALSAVVLTGCGDGHPPAERTLAFCEGIRIGDSYTAVEDRYAAFGMQAGGFARDPAQHLDARMTLADRQKVTGILAEPDGSNGGERPVCAIYYSDPFLGGDGKVVLTEFIESWVHRF